MIRVQKVIFPAILIAILFILLATQLIASPQVVLADNEVPTPVDTIAREATTLPDTSLPASAVAAPAAAPSDPTPPAGDTAPAARPSPAKKGGKPGKSTVPEVKPVFVSSKKPDQPGSGKCSLNSQLSGSILQWCDLIDKYAGQNNLDANLVAALITQESGGDPNAYSGSGAVGLMQVMPNDGLAASFTCPAGPCFAGRPSSQELFDPEYNIAYGTRMLAGLIQKYGSIREALKNYGPGNVGYYYADLVLGILNSYP